MYNKTEILRMERSIRKLEKCGGSCKECSHAKIKTASDNNSKNIYYAFYCDIDKDIQPYSNTLKNLQHETMEALLFEIGL